MEINKNCPCPKTHCERHGKCDECRAHHANKKDPPYCQKHKDSAKKK